MEVVALPVLAIVLVVGLVALFVWAHRKTEERRRLWRELAERRGGRYFPPEWSWLRSGSEAFEVRAGHAIVRVDLYVVSHGESSTTYTRARAHYALGAGPRMAVYAQGVLSSIGKALGTQDLELGDPELDDVFMVKGDDVEALRRVWTKPARAVALNQLRQARVEAHGPEVTLTCPGAVADVRTLEAMLELVGELASADARDLDRIAALPDASLVPAAGTCDAPVSAHVRIGTAAGDAVATVRPGARGPRLMLSLPSERALPVFSVEVHGGRADGLPSGVLTERAVAALRAADGATLSGDGGRLRVEWPSVPAPESVPPAAALLAELATGSRSAGAFR